MGKTRFRCGRLAARIPAILLTLALLASFPASGRADSVNGIAGGVVSALVVTLVCVAMTSVSNPNPDEDPYLRRGWLLGASGSFGIPTGESDLESDLQSVAGPTASLSLDEGLGMSGRAGYRCHQYMGAEAEIEWIDGFEGKVDDSNLGRIATLDVEPLVATANVKGYFPFGRYQPYALLGAGAMIAEDNLKDLQNLGFRSDDATSFAMRFGAGLDVFATEHVVATLGIDYVLPLGDLENLDYVSIGWGFEYRF